VRGWGGRGGGGENDKLNTFSQTRGTPKKTVGLASFRVEISVP